MRLLSQAVRGPATRWVPNDYRIGRCEKCAFELPVYELFWKFLTFECADSHFT